MHVRPDYETEDILAVFSDPDNARAAVRRLRELLGDPHRVVGLPLELGRYQLADTSLQEVVHEARRTARIGIPLGALAGLGLAVGVGLSAGDVRARPAPARREPSRVLGTLRRSRATAFLEPTPSYAPHPPVRA